MTQPFKIVIPDFINDDLAPEHQVFGDRGKTVAIDAHHESQLVGHIEDADAIMLYHNLSLTAATINKLDRCKLIVRCGVGYDNVDHLLAASRGIPVANVPDYGTEEVADSALAMALTLARGVHSINSTLRSKIGPYSYTQVAPLQRLRGKVFGIVGLGRIGTAAALRAKAFGMQVVFYDPLRPDGYDKAMGCTRVETLEELLAQAHILSLHCPLTDLTRHMINEQTLSQMRPGSFLVNTARGGVVDTKALPNALASGQLAGAGIDVLAQEPPTDDNPLVAAWRDPEHLAHHRLILNPHSAFYSEQGLMDMRLKGANACLNALLNQPVRNIVNQAALNQASAKLQTVS
ncbi:MAG: C-terminal binding protein [Phycisphaeraceae bacterium]|nr:C-terminal binding protein [Phycisphaeraceae bacterium]